MARTPEPAQGRLLDPQPPSDHFSGTVERVTFHNEENGFCVLRVQARGRRELVTVVGHAASVAPGEFVQAEGGWVSDPVHGVQFSAKVPEVRRADHGRGHREVPELRAS